MAELADAENAKRRVIMQLLDLGLPGVTRRQLTFDLLSSEAEPVQTESTPRTDAAEHGFDDVLGEWLPLTYALTRSTAAPVGRISTRSRSRGR